MGQLSQIRLYNRQPTGGAICQNSRPKRHATMNKAIYRNIRSRRIIIYEQTPKTSQQIVNNLYALHYKYKCDAPNIGGPIVLWPTEPKFRVGHGQWPIWPIIIQCPYALASFLCIQGGPKMAHHFTSAFHWSRHWWVASPAWVCRPAASWTHWTFDVKTAGYDSYLTDNKLVKLRCTKMVCQCLGHPAS